MAAVDEEKHDAPMCRTPYALAAPFLALLLTSSPALAAPWKNADRYIKLYTGVGITEDSNLHIKRPDRGFDLVFHDVTWEDNSLSRPSIPYIGVRGGVFFNNRPWLGIAVDVFHFKVFAETERVVRVEGRVDQTTVDGPIQMNQLVQQYDVANGINMFLFDVIGRLRLQRSGDFPNGRVQPYAGLGLGPTVLYTRSSVLNETRSGYELGKLGAQALAGLQLHISRRFDLFLEAKYTHTEANGSIHNGTSETTLESKHLVLGAGYHF